MTHDPPPDNSRWNQLKSLWHRLGHDQKAGVKGISWTALSQAGILAIRLSSTLILTRLLAPEAYGLLGAAMAVITTLEWLSDLGLVPALVRHRLGDQPTHLLTGWWMGLFRGLGLTTMGILLAFPLARIYEKPDILPVLCVLALRPTLMALRSPAWPVLRRQLNYKTIFMDEIGQTLVGTGASIALAFPLRSVWAIVLGTLAGTLASIVLTYFLRPMRPRWMWNRDAARDLGHLGRQVFVNTLVMALWLNLDRLLGLSLASATAMGLYVVAWNLASVAENLSTRALDVYFSMLTRRAEGDDRMHWHNFMIGRCMLLGMPVFTMGVLCAPIAVIILYDPRYVQAGVLLSLLLVRLMFRVLGQMQFQFLLAEAKVGIATRSYLVALVIQAASIVPLTHRFGVHGLAYSAIASTFGMTLTQTFLMRWRWPASRRPFFYTLLWALIATAGLHFFYGFASLD